MFARRLGVPHALGLAVVCGAALLGSACQKDDSFYFENLLQIEKGEGASRGEPSSTRIEELKAEIRRYREVVDKKVEASEQLGIYHKLLAVAYMRKEMYGVAYDNLLEALRYHPANSVLYLYAGICAGQMSKAQSQSEKALWLDRSESHYRRALELDPDYVEALYGLAVLETFELGKLADAERLVRKILTLRSRHEEASFLLANILYRSGRLPEAVAVYKSIADTAQAEASRTEALANKSRIEKEMRGAP